MTSQNHIQKPTNLVDTKVVSSLLDNTITSVSCIARRVCSIEATVGFLLDGTTKINYFLKKKSNKTRSEIYSTLFTHFV